MRIPALIALALTFVACSTTQPDNPYAEANSLMRTEIQARIANIPFEHNQELLNNLLWLEGKAGEVAIPFLLESLGHDDAKVRASSAWVLGRIRDRRVIPDLRPLVADEDPAVRFEVARSLVSMGDLKYAPVLIEGLDSEKAPVRYNCQMALRDATKRDFGYDHLEEDLATRRQGALRWRQWWGEQQGDPWFAENYARKYQLLPEYADIGTPAKPMGETAEKTDKSEIKKSADEKAKSDKVKTDKDKAESDKAKTDKVKTDKDMAEVNKELDALIKSVSPPAGKVKTTNPVSPPKPGEKKKTDKSKIKK